MAWSKLSEKLTGLNHGVSIFTIALLSLSATASSAESVAVQCGESKGWAYYFAGGLVPEDMEGFTEDGITGVRQHSW